MTMIRFACPQCHTEFQVEDKAAGKRTKCPKCGAAIIVPVAEQSYFSGAVALPTVADPVPADEPGIYSAGNDVPKPDLDDEWNRASSFSAPHQSKTQPSGGLHASPRVEPSRYGRHEDDALERDAAKTASRTRVAERLERKRYPALVLLAKFYWAIGVLGIVCAVLWIGLCLIVLLFVMRDPQSISSTPFGSLFVFGVWSVSFLLALVFETVVSFSVAEIIRWAVDMKTGNSTTNALLQAMLDRMG
jgi:predicted Zn finger-like uncharacterized protein